MEKDFMSGSELRQYLHISTRKMKYLMDHDYIPHENTGRATHKYRVRRDEAEKFKHRMETEDGFLAELAGKFSTRAEHRPRPVLEPTAKNSKAFRLWLEKEWAALPEALPTQTAASLAGFPPQRIHKLIKEKTLHGIKIGCTKYCVKEEFICYMASLQNLSNPRTDRYKELIREFKYEQHRERKNEERRCKRRNEKG